MSHSVGKLMDRKYQPVEPFEYFTDTKKRHERAQPVRLTQAFINSGQPASCRKETKEKTQPVKVKELLKELQNTNMSRKKNRPEIEETAKLSVRRKLYNSPKVTENSIFVTKTNSSATIPRRSNYVNNKNETTGPYVFKVPVQKLKNNTTSGNQRKSMLLPPNSIKNRYTRMKNSLSLAPNIKATSAKTTSKIKASKEVGTIVEAPNSDEMSMENRVFPENTIHDNELNTIMTDTDHNEAKDNNININPCSINLNSIISIDKQHLLRLQLHCQEMICAREKEMSELKQMLALIKHILEPDVSKNTRACLSTETTDTITQKESDKLTINETRERQNEETESLLKDVLGEEKCIESTQNMTSEKNKNSSQIIDSARTMDITKIDEKESETVEDTEEYKENFMTPSRSEKSVKKSVHSQQRRRSARLAALEIKLKETETDNCTEMKSEQNLNGNVNCNNQCTPAFSMSPRRKTLSRRKSKRHFTEYLALKSGISFLQTPDVKKMDDSLEEFNTPRIHSKNITSSMSTKLLSELNLLYEDSPI